MATLYQMIRYRSQGRQPNGAILRSSGEQNSYNRLNKIVQGLPSVGLTKGVQGPGRVSSGRKKGNTTDS
jgi:hypothetical protein